MADWSLPTLSSTYTNFLSQLQARDTDLALQFDGTTSSNIPTGAIRWTSSANTWQKWSGSAWGALSSTFTFPAITVSGVAALTGGGTSTTPAADNNTTNIATTAFVIGQASGTAPVMDGTAAIGSSLRYARQDHVHPTDTTRAPLASPTFTGTVTIPSGASISGYLTTATAASTYAPIGSSVPAGAVNYFAMSSAPSGYIKANGATISRTTYASLFAAIGTTFGAGDGSTTFAVPDLRGEFLRGWDDARGIDASRSLGSFQDQAYLSHSHGITDPGHNHSWSAYNGSPGGNFGTNYVAGLNAFVGYTAYSVNSSVTGITINAAGGAETRPRNVALLACIKY